MTIRLQGKWEAERVARIVEMWNPANGDLVPWRDDCVARMRRQIDDAKEKVRNRK